MKRSSLKRMLESSETSEMTSNSRDSKFKESVAVDLYSLPDHIDSKTVQGIVDHVKENFHEISDKDDLIRQITKLKDCMTTNLRLRVEFGDTLERFVGSELELVDIVKSFHALSLLGELYVLLPELELPSLLIQLLSHSNEDVGVEILSLLIELTDESVVSMPGDVSVFSRAIFACDFVPQMRLIFDRIVSPDDLALHLQLLSNVLEYVPELSLQLATPEWAFPLLSFLEKDSAYLQSLAVELLIPVLHTADPDTLASLVNERYIPILFGLRADQKKSSLETEFRESLSDLLCVLAASRGLRKCMGQGIPSLVTEMRTEGLTILNDCTRDSEENCNIFVEAMGLKPLGTIIMKEENISEHALTLTNSLLKNCTGQSLDRVACKFGENKCEKLEKLLHVINKYIISVRSNEKTTHVDKEESEEDSFLRKCEYGLFSLQQACLVLIRLFGSTKMQQPILQLVHALNVPTQEIIYTVHEYIELLHPERAETEINELRTCLVDFQSLAL